MSSRSARLKLARLKLTPPPVLTCGPLVRHVSRSSAVIWVETSEALEIEVQVEAEVPGGSLAVAAGVPSNFRAFTIAIEDSNYAWVALSWLVPDTWYRYRVIGHWRDGTSIPLWPDTRLAGTGLPSVFKTLPSWSLDSFRMAYTSCRKGFDPLDNKAPDTGPDALEGLAELMRRTFDERDRTWPHLLQMMGDQIYADDFSGRLERKFRHKLALVFTEFAQIYREAWTSRPAVRWVLSCIPSLMIFDDHEIDDDWNITSDWVQSRQTPAGIRQRTDGLMAYWVYQGAGNLDPRRWLADERMRLLTPRLQPLIGDVTDRLRRLCERYIRGTRRASWSYAVDVAGTRLAVTDTRMYRKLTGHRLMMDDQAWDEFVGLAKSHASKRVVIVTPGPYMLPVPLHDLESWVADKLENDPSIFERVATGAAGGLIGGIGGAIVGGIGGFLVGGPAGAIVGAGIGAGIGAGLGFTAGFFLEEIIEKVLGGKIGDLDIELWPVFPTSFTRMIGLLEDLADGRGTVRKRFITVLSGDVHFSYAMLGELSRTLARRQLWHLALSPTGNLLDENRDDVKTLKRLMGGDFSARTELNLMKLTGVFYRPDFVDRQFSHLTWNPLLPDGTRADASKPDDWAHLGNFLGWLEVQGARASYRYDKAVEIDGVVVLTPRTGSSMLAM
jgi:hypothetical protein